MAKEISVLSSMKMELQTIIDNQDDSVIVSESLQRLVEGANTLEQEKVKDMNQLKFLETKISDLEKDIASRDLTIEDLKSKLDVMSANQSDPITVNMNQECNIDLEEIKSMLSLLIKSANNNELVLSNISDTMDRQAVNTRDSLKCLNKYGDTIVKYSKKVIDLNSNVEELKQSNAKLKEKTEIVVAEVKKENDANKDTIEEIVSTAKQDISSMQETMIENENTFKESLCREQSKILAAHKNTLTQEVKKTTQDLDRRVNETSKVLEENKKEALRHKEVLETLEQDNKETKNILEKFKGIFK